MSHIHFVGGEKGGVGKSVLARLLAQWFIDRSTPFAAVDGDLSHGALVRMYADYSQPWFRTHKVLRGGCWVTRSRLLRNTWRNFYTPDRRDVWAGFRTCAL